jgi:hypothetical protein
MRTPVWNEGFLLAREIERSAATEERQAYIVFVMTNI